MPTVEVGTDGLESAGKQFKPVASEELKFLLEGVEVEGPELSDGGEVLVCPAEEGAFGDLEEFGQGVVAVAFGAELEEAVDDGLGM